LRNVIRFERSRQWASVSLGFAASDAAALWADSWTA